MSKRQVLLEKDCDCSIHSYVNLGLRIKDVPSGWALNLHDFREFFPVLRYELECYVQIKGIISPCKIRINPRLFYRSVPLKNHLRSLKSSGENKVSIEVKFNKKEIYDAIDDFGDVNLDYIDTSFTVGKSYSSKGWALTKDVISKILPLSAYEFRFPVYIDGIPVENRLNMQTRLFYNSEELSQKLEELYKVNRKQKVDARIILNEEYLKMINSVKKTHLSNKQCIVCGNFIDDESQSVKCFDCLDKEVTAFKLKKFLEFFNSSDLFYEDDLIDLGYTKGQIKIMTYKFEKYELLSVNWDGGFKLKNNQILNDFIKKWG